MLQKEVRLLVGLLGEGGACGESGVGTWTGLGVGLNSKEEELWLIDSKLLVRGIHGVTERTSLNWLFGVSKMLNELKVCSLLCRKCPWFYKSMQDTNLLYTVI